MSLRSALTLMGEASALLRYAATLDGNLNFPRGFSENPRSHARSPKYSLTLESLRSGSALAMNDTWQLWSCLGSSVHSRLGRCGGRGCGF